MSHLQTQPHLAIHKIVFICCELPSQEREQDGAIATFSVYCPVFTAFIPQSGITTGV